MKYQSILTSLFYLLIYADDNVNEKEVAIGKQMANTEGFDEQAFNKELESIKSKDAKALLADCIVGLKKLDAKSQIRCVAWLCVVANGDGFMDKEEWTLIFKIYHTELGLPIGEIMEVQKELNKIIHGRSFQSIGVRINE
jgi:uncharacterized tellurite resistance protein B-like protein